MKINIQRTLVILSQQTHNVVTTSLQRTALQQRCNDVVVKLCVYWVAIIHLWIKGLIKYGRCLCIFFHMGDKFCDFLFAFLSCKPFEMRLHYMERICFQRGAISFLYGQILLRMEERKQFTDNPLYTDTRYNEKIRYYDNLTVTKSSHKR